MAALDLLAFAPGQPPWPMRLVAGVVRVVRLLANGALDTDFGSAGARDFDCEPDSATSDDAGTALTLSGGRAAALGSRSGLPADDGVCLARLSAALIFRSSFESGLAWGWAATSP